VSHKFFRQHIASIQGAQNLTKKLVTTDEKSGWNKGVLPDVLGEPVLDEVLVLMLVEPHEDGVVAGVGPRFEVENHPESLAGGPPERIAEGRGSPGFGRRN
jgi:hypothetical protein